MAHTATCERPQDSASISAREACGSVAWQHSGDKPHANCSARDFGYGGIKRCRGRSRSKSKRPGRAYFFLVVFFAFFTVFFGAVFTAFFFAALAAIVMDPCETCPFEMLRCRGPTTLAQQHDAERGF